MRTIFLLSGLLLASAATAADQPNIVVLFADDLGYGDLSSYGHPTIRTPNIDRLAGEGLRLTSFYSAPACVQARIRLLTGRYPIRTEIRGTSVDGKGGIPEGELTLPEALRSAGYKTGMVGKWHLGYAESRFLPTGQGFDSWLGLPYSNDMIKPWVQTDEPLWLYDDTERVEHPVDQDTLTTRYTERAVRFIRESRNGPFFLYFAYSMPHLPLHTADRFRGHSRGGLYGDVIETIDWSVGEVLETLEQLGLADNTIVIFTSDNGPWQNPPDRMLQKGNLRTHAGSTGLLRGSKATTYEGGVRVPCIVRWPGAVPAGRVSAEMAATTDLFVTLVQAAGAKLPEHTVDGFDLRPFFAADDEASPRQEQLYFWRGQVVGLRAGKWKLHSNSHVRAGWWKGEDAIELFDLDADPAESVNLAGDEPSVLRRLKLRAQVVAEELGAGVPWGADE